MKNLKRTLFNLAVSEEHSRRHEESYMGCTDGHDHERCNDDDLKMNMETRRENVRFFQEGVTDEREKKN